MSGDFLWSGVKSGIPGANWPPVVTGPAAALQSLVVQFEHSQWLDPADIEANQLRQLRAVARHCQKHSPHFARRLKAAGLTADDLVSREALRKLPLLTRRDLQSARDIFCREVPPAHRPLLETRTSGSTGEPVAVRRTTLCNVFWLAANMRKYFWFERDFSWRVSSIRARLPKYAVERDWGQPANLLFKTGPSQSIPVTAGTAQQIAWIKEFDPHILVVYPNIMDAILRHCRTHGVRFGGLKAVRFVGETVAERLRDDTETYLGVKTTANYSSREVGVIAIECPEGGGYHAVAENIMVEILDGKGEPCTEGETGRVVVTDLSNFATPMIRYVNGDYAQMGSRCACGRGLPVIKRILGRERNFVLMPDGTRHYPLVGFARFRDIAPVVQYQFIQEDRYRIEGRLVTQSPLTAGQEAALRTVVQEALGYPFEIGFVYFPEMIPRGPSGKFDEFICRIGADTA